MADRGALIEDDLRDLIQQRADTIDQLRVAFTNTANEFTPRQQRMLDEKLNYGGDPMRVQTYVSTFLPTGKIDQATADRVSN